MAYQYVQNLRYIFTYFDCMLRYDGLFSLSKLTWEGDRIPERELESDYDRHSPERNFHEWGARVTAAIKAGVTPRWAVYLLAGTYWRIWGHQLNALHCYKHALAKVPQQYKDVVLVNFAGKNELLSLEIYLRDYESK